MKIDVTINVPTKGLVLLWALGFCTGVIAMLPGSFLPLLYAPLFALMSYACGRQVWRETLNSLRVTVSDGEPPACKN